MKIDQRNFIKLAWNEVSVATIITYPVGLKKANDEWDEPKTTRDEK
jgi:hypothetical protein